MAWSDESCEPACALIYTGKRWQQDALSDKPTEDMGLLGQFSAGNSYVGVAFPRASPNITDPLRRIMHSTIGNIAKSS